MRPLPPAPYLVLDPTDDYARRMVEFLGRLGLSGVAVLTSPGRTGQWRHGWKGRLAEHVVASYEAVGEPLPEGAAQLARDFPEGCSGIVPWDEMSVLYGAELGELLDLGWNPRRVIERCRDKGEMKEHL